MKIAIGAIFRDEYEYIIEWLAWHQIAGFDAFYIADNASTDGSTALLEALENLGHITLIYQPIVEKYTQTLAYNRITQYAINEIEYLLFLDADEFITHESMENGIEAKYLKKLLSKKNIGGVCMNWRTFGSSDNLKFNDAPVVERFNWHQSDKGGMVNRHIKSVAKIQNIILFPNPHIAKLSNNIDYVDTNGNIITDFIAYINGKAQPVSVGGLTTAIRSSPLRINHYVIKSKQEFVEKKRKRGNAMQGVNKARELTFFEQHDFKDEFFAFPDRKKHTLSNQIKKLKIELERTAFYRNLKGAIDIIDANIVKGWLTDEKGNSENLRINVFVNGVFQGFTYCGFHRQDLQDKEISLDGCSGFRYFHPHPLKVGDMVEVRAHENRYVFINPQRSITE